MQPVSFSFNFGAEEDENKNNEEVNLNEEDAIKWNLNSGNTKKINELDIWENVNIKNDFEPLKKLKPSTISTQDCSYRNQLQTHDLIPGTYEGGFKLWECSIDLCKFILDRRIDLKGKRVMELGCGHGLPGILALKMGANVIFQDYNQEVIQNLTIPNVLLNVDEKTAQDRTEFFSGDWNKMEQLLSQNEHRSHYRHTFDYILTSDTLYSVSSIPKLLNLMRFCLKQPVHHSNISNSQHYPKENEHDNNHPLEQSLKSVALIASKRYYFGVGGGVSELEDILERPFYSPITRLKFESDITNGKTNIRDILSLSFI
eukprot:gb/GECH01007609.1/.p1 GENE.gb/GECH01007609.1/~~gb/GECH01007609.1/.p1  ORF type:complete len:315 (+),score=83.00 gb/GECH01007609.1/:1-945(+)